MMTTMTNKTKTKPKTRPFKKFYCDRPNIFLIPAPAFKIWMYHYAREGRERQSWPSIDKLCKALNMGEDSIYKWRKWLTDNGWLVKTGERGSNGVFKVPVMQVKDGTIPGDKGSGSDGRRKRTDSESIGYGDRLRKYRRPTDREVSGTDAPIVSASARPDSIGAEVEPSKQVEPLREVKPKGNEMGPVKGCDLVSSRPSSVEEQARQAMRQRRAEMRAGAQ
jgi:hypothetical protein